MVRLSEAAGKVAKNYSGGMRRRLDLAASLAGRPSVIFLDEPATGLDPANREDRWDVVRSLVSDGSTVLLTTQYLEEADALAEQITVIDHGKVIAHDTLHSLKPVAGGAAARRAPDRPGHARRPGDSAFQDRPARRACSRSGRRGSVTIHGVRERYREAEKSGDYLAVSSVVLFELWYGVEKSGRVQENTGRCALLLSGDLDLLYFDDEDARTAGRVRAALNWEDWTT